MIKRSLYFGNPAYLSTTKEQLVIRRKDCKDVSTPIEDLGIVVLDNQQITITHALLAKLMSNNVAVITCNETHHPTGMMLNLDGNTLQSMKFKAQINASIPLKKQLWAYTVAAKLRNQGNVLNSLGKNGDYLIDLARQVRSADAGNCEAQGAVYYWKHLFSETLAFQRERQGFPPNNLLNYGYAILRALVARCLTGSGLLPTLGIFHRNQYNAYCLADDIMEPYRPFVDTVVAGMSTDGFYKSEIDSFAKQELLKIPAMDVQLNGQKSPLMNAVQRTTASLAKSFESKRVELLYPEVKSSCLQD